MSEARLAPIALWHYGPAKDGAGGKLALYVPPDMDAWMKTWAEKHQDKPLTVALKRWYRKRTTGYKSQNHRVNGFILQICQETGNDFDAVKMYCKEQAITRGYPSAEFRGRIVPKSEAETSTIECAALIETIEQLAAELGIRLREE